MLKKYQVQGRELIQLPLKNRQMFRLGPILGELDLDKLKTRMEGGKEFGDLIADLGPELLSRFLNVIFDGQDDGIDWGEETADLTLEIIEDFLSLNPGLIRKSGSLYRNLVSIRRGAAAEEPEDSGKNTTAR